jgi:hypothetical protein
MVYALWRFHRVSNNIRYTVATTIGRFSTPRNPSQIEYEFSINGKPYYGSSATIPNYPVEIFHGRYYVQVPMKSKGASKILWEQPVPDSVKAPAEGWAQLPR